MKLNLWAFELFCLAALSFQIAHSHIAVKFSQSEISPIAFFCFEKSKENLSYLLRSTHLLQRYYSKIFRDLSSIFLELLKQRLVHPHYTTSLAYFKKFVKYFLQIFTACLKRHWFCLPYMYGLIIHTHRGCLSQRDPVNK